MPVRKPTAAVIGISGFLGSSLVKELVKTGKYAAPIHALGRNVSRYPENSDVKYIETDIFDPESVAKGLEGVEVVFDTLGFIDETNVAKGVAASPSVKLVFPAIYGSEYYKSSFKDVLVKGTSFDKWVQYDDKFAIRQLCIGFFQQWWVDNVKDVLQLDLDKGAAVVPGTGNEELTFTYELDVARSLAQLGYRPAGQLPKYSFVGGDIKSYDQVLNLIERATGKTITRSYIPKEEQLKKTRDGLAGGDPAVFMDVLRSTHLEPGVTKFEKYDNDYINPGLWQWTKFETTIQNKFSN